MSTPSPSDPQSGAPFSTSAPAGSAKTPSPNIDYASALHSADARIETTFPVDALTSPRPELRESHFRSPPQRRMMLPILLFIATCLSTFWVGATNWKPTAVDAGELWSIIASNWQQGLTYMGAVLAILLTHEMGHFLQTVRYRIPASYPLCIPVPFSLIGTMGAVISMDGMRANRKQIFDIGIAGPLAGLVVAAPILYLGVSHLHLDKAGTRTTSNFTIRSSSGG